MTFARLTAVYGLQYSELRYRMPLASLKAYLERIPRVVAERKLIAGNAALLPRLEDPGEILDQWVEEAFGEEHHAEVATPGMLKMMGIGVEHVGT